MSLVKLARSVEFSTLVTSNALHRYRSYTCIKSQQLRAANEADILFFETCAPISANPPPLRRGGHGVRPYYQSVAYDTTLKNGYMRTEIILKLF